MCVCVCIIYSSQIHKCIRNRRQAIIQVKMSTYTNDEIKDWYVRGGPLLSAKKFRVRLNVQSKSLYTCTCRSSRKKRFWTVFDQYVFFVQFQFSSEPNKLYPRRSEKSTRNADILTVTVRIRIRMLIKNICYEFWIFLLRP